ncbi:MAG: hypothetical protein WD773_08055 [Gemmatimonadales bacterium]
MNHRVVLSLMVLATACIHTFRTVDVQPVERTADSVSVGSPVKAHMVDGSTVVFRDGVIIARDTVWGAGNRYDLALRDSTAIVSLALDSVVGMESFRTHVNQASSIVVSTLSTAGAVLVVAGAAVLIACLNNPKCFGSCPTYYADSAGTHVLEAEGFSYSIAPLFEARDVDRLRFPAASDGTVRIEVRNEAFETHYINHLELLEVRHAEGEFVLPDEQNRPVIVRDLAAAAAARDRRGTDLGAILADPDGSVYRTDPEVLSRARVGDLEDAIELTAPVAAGADSVAVVLRLRNSLLNTILFYDIMLGDPGARSLDWVGQRLEEVGPAVELAQWYQRKMGMRIAVWDGDRYREVAHLKDTGPVAWKDVALVIPVLDRRTLRLRLSFPADNWRIDRVAIASHFRREPAMVHPLAAVWDAAEQRDTTARASLLAADGRYLETTGGQRFTAEFQAGTAPANTARTFFLASQGYYTEWVRRGWLTAPRASRTFVPSDSALSEAISRWRITQDTLEARFMATRIPVR